MKKLFLAIALIACTAVHAEFLHMRGPNFSITLTPNACPAEVADNLKPDFKDKFREAWMVLNGRTVLACWIPHVEDPSIVVLLTDSGQALGVELKGFKADKGI